ncbi:MAG: hypothetical protein A2Z20_07475 [Bdellovibrionales bacterium RBG_16_40_8]|nr:MAG: hypothetical protein A2Z20_07475 [Bdellovibrionales bacterium RBG_16_40_8]
MKLEQVGPFRIARPSACAVWDPVLPDSDWRDVDAEFVRFSDGRGEWKIKNQDIKNPWVIEVHGIFFNLKLTSFGHLGIFFEQEKNWLQLREIIGAKQSKGSSSQENAFRVLNLFAYTGGATLFAAAAGAQVVHLDASKGSVKWARENAESSGLTSHPIRWIVDDVQEFIEKEIRRGSKYQGIILDPPSFGRGNTNQAWKIEDHLLPLLKNLRKLMADDFAFLLLSAHSPGYTPISLENQLRQVCADLANANLKKKHNDYVFESGEMLIYDTQKRALPSGAYCLLEVRRNLTPG